MQPDELDRAKARVAPLRAQLAATQRILAAVPDHPNRRKLRKNEAILIRILAELQEMIALMERQTQPLDSRKEPPRS